MKVGSQIWSADDGGGWFAYSPTPGAVELPQGPTVEVSLIRDEYAGPFRDEVGPRGDDFAGLHAEVGLSRELFDDALAWHLDYVDRPRPTPDGWDHDHRRREHESGPGPDVRRRRHRPVADSVGWPPRAGFEEETLPISPDLRQAIEDWVHDETRILGLDHDWTEDMVRHDRRGHQLSTRLQAELGTDYRVEYRSGTRQVRREHEPDD